MLTTVIALLSGLLVLPLQKSITLTDPGGVDTVTFPVSSFSEEQIRALMRLSPKLVSSTSYPVMVPIDTCVKSDPEYRGCGKQNEPGPWFANNAMVSINHMEDALRALDSLPKSNGLAPVISYQRTLQVFYIEINKTLLQYDLSADVSVLEHPIGSINPVAYCADSLASIRHATSRQAADGIARIGWYTCMNAEMRRRAGPYPFDAWRVFLESHGIQETYVPAEDN